MHRFVNIFIKFSKMGNNKLEPNLMRKFYIGTKSYSKKNQVYKPS